MTEACVAIVASDVGKAGLVRACSRCSSACLRGPSEGDCVSRRRERSWSSMVVAMLDGEAFEDGDLHES